MAALPDKATMYEVQRKRKFYALVRAQYWKFFGQLISFASLATAVILPFIVLFRSGSVASLILLLLPLLSSIGAAAFFNIKANLMGLLFALLGLGALFLSGLVIQFGFLHAGGIDGSGSYYLVGWIVVFAQWVVIQKAPAALRKAQAMPPYLES